jgi:hypothetical protein
MKWIEENFNRRDERLKTAGAVVFLALAMTLTLYLK